MGSNRNSRAHRNMPCMGCMAATAAEKASRADTSALFGLAQAEIHGVQRVFEGLCPTHRNTYRLIRDAIDKHANAQKNASDAVEMAVANMAAEKRQ